jgi:hypothetical protein
MDRGEHTQVLADVAEGVALWNEFRTDDFQDDVVRLVNDARERWRDEDGELPPPGTDPLFDALMGLADAADSAPLAVREAAAHALAVAEDVRVTR